MQKQNAKKVNTNISKLALVKTQKEIGTAKLVKVLQIKVYHV